MGDAMTSFNLAGAIADVSVRILDGANGYLDVAGTRADYLAGAPTAVDALEIVWSRPSARDHANPGGIQLSLLSRDKDATIEWGAEVYVWAVVNGIPDRSIAHGWINNIARRRAGRGLEGWRWDLDLVDALGRAAGHIVRAEPWPVEFAANRIVHRLNPLGIVTITPADDAAATRMVAPRDTNSQNLLDLARYSAGVGYVVGENHHGLSIEANLPGTNYRLPATPAVTIPADAVEDLGVDVNRAGAIIEGNVRFKEPDNDGEWHDANIYRRTDDARDGGRYTLETDDAHVGVYAPYPPDTVARNRTARYLEAIIAATATPRPRIRASRVAAGPWLEELITLDHRNPAPMVRLDALPAYHGLDDVHHMTGGRLTLEAGRVTLVAEFQPAAWEGWERATWGDVDQWPRRVIRDELAPPGSPRHTFGDYSTARLFDL